MEDSLVVDVLRDINSTLQSQSNEGLFYDFSTWVSLAASIALIFSALSVFFFTRKRYLKDFSENIKLVHIYPKPLSSNEGISSIFEFIVTNGGKQSIYIGDINVCISKEHSRITTILSNDTSIKTNELSRLSVLLTKHEIAKLLNSVKSSEEIVSLEIIFNLSFSDGKTAKVKVKYSTDTVRFFYNIYMERITRIDSPRPLGSLKIKSPLKEEYLIETF